MNKFLTIFIVILLSLPVFAQDTDSDGIVTETCVCTPVDNCPNTYNPDQHDCDGDGVGDACDASDGCIDTDVVDTGVDTGVYTDTDTGSGTPGDGFSLDVISNILDINSDGILNGHSDDVFAICGDSHSATPATTTYRTSYYMGQCGSNMRSGVELYPEIENSLLAFDGGDAGGVTSFNRYSVAASGGWKSSWLVNDPSYIYSEIDAIKPFAVTIMFGTNDAQLYESTDYADILTVVDNVIEIADIWASEGVIPIIISPPVRYDKIEVMEIIADELRIAAESASYPFVDFHAATEQLDDYGLRSTTSVHLGTAAWNKHCCLTAECESGTSVYHLMALQALDSVRETIR